MIPVVLVDGPRFWVALAITVALSAGAALAVEEWRWMSRAGRLTSHAKREMALSWGCLIPNTLAAFALIGFWTLLYSRVQRFVPWQLPVNVFTAGLALLAVDLAYYWEHRMAHRIPFLWQLYHAAHHSSDEYTIATAYRVSFVNHLVAPLFFLPCVLAGFDALFIAMSHLLVIHYQAWVHTEMIGPLGWIDRVLNTPANHRIHHSAREEHAHCNFGGMFVLWDHLFGTRAVAHSVGRSATTYGIRGTSPPRSLFELHTAAWRRRSIH